MNGWTWLQAKLAGDVDPSRLFLELLAIRLVNALTLRTYFQADEYWQALEPAHITVFGYGFLTWEWRLGLRSYLHPLLYTTIYQVCSWLELGYAYLLNVPKAVDGLIAAIGETYLYYLSRKLTNDDIAKLTVVLSLLSSFNWYCTTRSFSNTLEMHLTTAALYYFPMSGPDLSQLGISLLIAAFTCMIRPTNVIFWVYYGVRYLQASFSPSAILLAAVIGGLAFAFDMIINHQFYGEWKVPLLEFINFNVSKSLSSFYGVARLDFYFLQAIPILLLNLLPFLLVGLYYTKGLKDVKIVSILYLVIFSLIQHKEFRFIYPLMPFFLIFAACGMSHLFKNWSKRTSQWVLAVTAVLSSFLAFYFSVYHESGVIAITGYLRDKVLAEESLVDIGFITPCHSTPYQSYFHLDPNQANIWWLTCEPPLHLNSSKGLAEYRDESDQFYDDPALFLDTNFPALKGVNEPPASAVWPHKWPRYLVIFQHMEPFMSERLNGSYVEDTRLFNSRFHWDYRRTGDLIVYRNDYVQ